MKHLLPDIGNKSDKTNKEISCIVNLHNVGQNIDENRKIMNWTEIKKDIQKSLNERGLKKPSIRLNALENIESILRINFPKFIENPQENFKNIEKNFLKSELAKYKENGCLNSAESSVINEIYYHIK